MKIETILAFAITCFALKAVPGRGILETVGRGLAHGLRRTFIFILRIFAGDLIYLFLARFGLAMLASAYGEVFVVIRWVGAAYPVYLGIKAWLEPAVPLESASMAPANPQRGFMGGLVMTLVTPK